MLMGWMTKHRTTFSNIYMERHKTKISKTTLKSSLYRNQYFSSDIFVSFARIQLFKNFSQSLSKNREASYEMLNLTLSPN